MDERIEEMFYMLTALEIQHIKNVIEDLTALSDPSEYTKNEIDEALELLDKLLPIECGLGLEIFEKNIALCKGEDI